jgi:cardiolipin synthase
MPSLRDLPNALTIARMVLVVPLLALLLLQHYVAALWLAVICGISDALDGALARRFGWQTRLGGILDPLADKLLLLGVFAALAWLGDLPRWLFVLIVLRDIVIVTGGVVYHYRIEPVNAEPTRLSKLNTLCQVVLMWTLLLGLAGLSLPESFRPALFWTVAATVVVTLIQYVWIWSRRARDHGGKRTNVS